MNEPMNREDYLAMLMCKRQAALSITDGLLVYLTAELDAEIANLKSQPPEDRGAIVAQLTEDLMTATARVQSIETQAQMIHVAMENLPADVVALLGPCSPLINEVLMPMVWNIFQKQRRAAIRERDEIQAELMEYEPAETGAAE